MLQEYRDGPLQYRRRPPIVNLARRYADAIRVSLISMRRLARRGDKSDKLERDPVEFSVHQVAPDGERPVEELLREALRSVGR